MTISSANYTSLITSEHAGAENFNAMVALLTQCMADLQNFYDSLPAAFDIDTAVGVQLDQVGLWVGLSRKLPEPLSGIYFAFDTTGVGFDQGSWQGPFDPTTGLVSLDDATYRTFLYAKVGANNWDGTTPSMQMILQSVFPPDSGTLVFVQDNQDMSITVGIVGTLPSAVVSSLLLNGFLPLKPEGVGINYVIPSVTGPIFGFDVENTYISGFDVGSWAVPL